MKRLALLLAICTISASIVTAAPPAEVDIQSKILISDLPLTGNGYFKFALSDAGNTTNYWANDGSATGEPAGGITGAVYNGVFSGILGDTTIMTAIDPDAIYVMGDVYLRIWFSEDNVIFGEMLPAQRVVSTPYSIHADQVDGYDADDLISEATNRVTLSGDVSGTPGGGITIDELQGGALDLGSPSTDEVIMWDGSAWTSAPISSVTGDLYVNESGDSMTGALGIDVGAGNGLVITNTGSDIMIGNAATARNRGVAVGSGANGVYLGAAFGYSADGSFTGIAVGVSADGSGQGIALGNNANGRENGFAAGRNSTGYNYGIGIGEGAYGRSFGIAIGEGAQGYASAVAIGAQANGDDTNIAIGVSASCMGGSERISIGHNVANGIDDTACIRGTFFMEGGTALVARSTFGSGPWQTLVPLPLIDNVIYVATNGTPAGPGTIDRPFDTPQNGYNAAAALNPNSVATLVICGGLHPGGLMMTAGNVHVLGYSRPQLGLLSVMTPSLNMVGKQRVENVVCLGAAQVASDGGSDVKFHNCRFQNGLSILGPRVEVQDCHATGSDGNAVVVGTGAQPIEEIAIYNSSIFVKDSANSALVVNDLVSFFEVIGCEIINYGNAPGIPWAAIEDLQMLPISGGGQVPHLYSHNVIQGAEHGTWTMGGVPAVYDPNATMGATICFVQNTVWGDVGMTSNQQFFANNIIYGDINNLGAGMTWGWGQAGVGSGQDAAGNTEHQGIFPGGGGSQRGFPAAWQD